MWITATTYVNESLRIGINPEGAYSVQFFENHTAEIAHGFKLDDVKCSRSGGASWSCQVCLSSGVALEGSNAFKPFFQFTVPMSLLPPTTSTFTFYQSVHFHRLEPSYAKRLFWRAAEVPPTPSPLNFVGATCHGFDPREEVDWRGCNSDARYSFRLSLQPCLNFNYGHRLPGSSGAAALASIPRSGSRPWARGIGRSSATTYSTRGGHESFNNANRTLRSIEKINFHRWRRLKASRSKPKINIPPPNGYSYLIASPTSIRRSFVAFQF